MGARIRGRWLVVCRRAVLAGFASVCSVAGARINLSAFWPVLSPRGIFSVPREGGGSVARRNSSGLWAVGRPGGLNRHRSTGSLRTRPCQRMTARAPSCGRTQSARPQSKVRTNNASAPGPPGPCPMYVCLYVRMYLCASIETCMRCLHPCACS